MSEALIVRHCSPTLAGLKTANMFNYDFVDRAELMESIRSVNALLKDKGVRMIPLRVTNGRALIYVYSNEKEAEKTFARFKKCTDVYCMKLKEGCSLNKLAVATAVTALFNARSFRVSPDTLRELLLRSAFQAGGAARR